ncbi:timeless protein-domain-containing protein [Mrakia frigida]|uniref:Tof1p n=1 Tax=Mrakia frigida TaxID=29902 RepID=UPI003FCC0175
MDELDATLLPFLLQPTTHALTLSFLVLTMDLDDDDAMGGYGHEEEIERRQQQARRRGEDAGGEEDSEGDEEDDRLAVIEPVVRTLVAALGGWEDEDDPETGLTSKIYRPGDSIVGCLRDLKKLWRKDDTDDERTVARIFSRSGIIRELVAILEEVSERGAWGTKVGLMAADLLAAMTWPIDVAAELKEMEDEPEGTTDYSSLLQAQLEYKAAVLRSGVLLDKLMDMIIPSLANGSGERQDKDERIISLALHIVRNLLAIKDSVGSSLSSTDSIEKSTLQSTLIIQLHSSHFIGLLLTLASEAQTKDSNPFNVLVLDTLQLIFRGIRAADLAKDQKTAVRDSLSSLLETEDLKHQALARNSSSRHSRFGTTVSVHTAGNHSKKVVIHRSGAITGDAGELMDLGKKRGPKGKTRKNDELSQPILLVPEAMKILQDFAHEFLEFAFNNFFASILKDIRMERPKIRETDNVRALFLCTFFIEFFLLSRSRVTAAAASDVKGKGREGVDISKVWDFGYVAEFAEIDAVKWVVGRMRLVMDDKPIGWTELQAGINCFTQILLLIDAMAVSGEEEPVEAAEILQNQIYYNGDILELAFDVVAKFKDQSVAYLDAVVHLAYVLLRMLEKYSKSNVYMFVRKRKAKRAKRKGVRSSRGDDDGEDEDIDPDRGAVNYAEHKFAFEKYETRFADEHILSTLLTYLERFADFDSPEKMKRVVGLLHRLAVKVKAEGLFFKVSVLELFRRILENQIALPKDPSSKDLLALVNFILRKFFKTAQESPFLLVEAFFPKNRNKWKAFSSWAPEDGEEPSGDEGTSRVKKVKIPTDVQIADKGLTHTQNLGIAVAVLLDEGKMSHVTWVIEMLNDVAAARQEIILNTDGIVEIPVDLTDDEIRAHASKKVEASTEALEKFTDHHIEYNTEERKTAVTMDAHLKLMFRLLFFEMTSEAGVTPLQWTIPAFFAPSELEANARIIEGFIREPLDLDGERASDKLKKKLAPRKRRVLSRPQVSDDDVGEQDYDVEAGGDAEVKFRRAKKGTTGKRRSRARHASVDEGEEPRSKRTKKKKEQDVSKFKSAQFIQDSDDDDEADEAFWAAEKARIERTKQQSHNGADAAGSVDISARGTAGGSKKRKSTASSSTTEGEDGQATSTTKKPRPKPKARVNTVPSAGAQDDREESMEMENEEAGSSTRGRSESALPTRSEGSGMGGGSDDEEVEEIEPSQGGALKKKKVVVWSDDDDE